MRIESGKAVVVGVLLLVVLTACGGEPLPENLLEKSRQIPELSAFGALYLPLYEKAIVDSNWVPIRSNIRELMRLKARITALDVPDNIRLKKNEWESNQRLFARAVDNLAVVITWSGEREEANRVEIAEGVQRAYDWWQMLVEMLR
jgi:hypothetical protein